MNLTSTDGDVVLRSMGEPEAFGELFDRHFDDVRAYFARRVDVDTAADLAAEVFRIGFERRRSFDPQRSSSCRPWLFGIARNVLATEWERAGRRELLIGRLRPLVDSDAADDSVEAIDAARRWAVVARALAALDEATRELLLLVAWDRMTYEEVAEVVGIPLGTVRSRISRARADLSRLVAERTPCHD
jgi:RNA polymerase sigma factor (sigma-70 family)